MSTGPSKPAPIDPHLLAATSARDEKRVREALQAGADPNGVREKGDSALHTAIALKHANGVRALIEAGADVNAPDSFGQTPLGRAAGLAEEVSVRLLLEAGANPNTPGADKEPPIFIAVRSGNLEIVRLMLEHGTRADSPHASQTGFMALHSAALQGNLAIALALIDHGISVDVRDKDQNTPLHWACGGGRTRVVAELLARGADPGAVNANGDTPMHDAFFSRDHFEEIFRVLLAAGADPTAKNARGLMPGARLRKPRVVEMLAAARAEHLMSKTLERISSEHGLSRQAAGP